MEYRDLTAWRVSIPRLTTDKDSSEKVYFAYVIEVQRVDSQRGKAKPYIYVPISPLSSPFLDLNCFPSHFSQQRAQLDGKAKVGGNLFMAAKCVTFQANVSLF